MQERRGPLAKAIVMSVLEVAAFNPNILARDRLAKRVPEAQFVESLEGCSIIDLLIEVVFEDMATKRKLLRDGEPYLWDEAFLASNTSCLDPDTRGEMLNCPERLVGLHFFKLPARNPLVEVICSEPLNDASVDSVVEHNLRMK